MLDQEFYIELHAGIERMNKGSALDHEPPKIRPLNGEERDYIASSVSKSEQLWRTYEVNARRYDEAVVIHPVMREHFERMSEASLIFASICILQIESEEGFKKG
ncbi:MAG TPA: hypothetical protein PKD20_01985 [Candidatus Saccharibacteria bacterium]|jgi:hypothetical protein|nr:hypothetical protein [Candidatus Saccharibacteria bacterium]